jgi:hypothetical protein
VADHKKLEEEIEVAKEAEKKATRKAPKYQYPPDGIIMWNHCCPVDFNFA